MKGLLDSDPPPLLRSYSLRRLCIQPFFCLKKGVGRCQNAPAPPKQKPLLFQLQLTLDCHDQTGSPETPTLMLCRQKTMRESWKRLAKRVGGECEILLIIILILF